MNELNVSAANGISQAASATAATTLSSDFNTFLQLLTAQVTNQDPLSPLDSTQFVEQLATFSGLEQQVATNSHLESIIAMLQQSIGDQSTTLLGKEAAAPSVQVENGRFQAQRVVTSEPAEGNLLVRDAQGVIVFQSEFTNAWQWNGLTTDGQDVPDGAYRFEIATADGIVPAFMRGTIDRVIGSGNDLSIGFASGVTASSYQLSDS